MAFRSPATTLARCPGGIEISVLFWRRGAIGARASIGAMSDEPSIRVREDRARRALARYRHRLHKTPARSWLRKYGPGYMIVEAYTNTVVMGATNRAYTATLEDVEGFVEELRLESHKAA